MTDNEILEGNRMIAEFMGAKYDKETAFSIPPEYLWLPFHGICRHTTVGVGKGSILQYHKSWDWLMPVVEKIESFGFRVEIFNQRCLITNLNLKGDPFPGRPNADTVRDFKIDAVWTACVMFIVWHDKQTYFK